MADGIVSDPALLKVLEHADNARDQSGVILDLLEGFHSEPAPKDSTQNLLALSKQQKILMTHLMLLRGANRKAVMSVRQTKQQTTEARQEIDSLHLQLQNLCYEQNHLKGEIQACEEYKHKYTQLGMISTEEYLAAHPEAASLSEHELTVARIEDEYAQRKALQERKEALQKRKEALIKENNAKKEKLAKQVVAFEKYVATGEAIVEEQFGARAQTSFTGT